MSRPLIVVVDDEVESLDQLADELRRRYAADYRIVADTSSARALKTIQDACVRGTAVALVLADQWMPDTTGIELLSQVHAVAPEAKRGVLIDWGDAASTAPLLGSFSLGRFDSWIVKPVRRPAEEFHRSLGELLTEWVQAHGPTLDAIRIVGDRWSARSHEIRDLLSRNNVPFLFLDRDSRDGSDLLRRVGVVNGPFPVMELWDGRVLCDPSTRRVAENLGLRTAPTTDLYDVVIVGAGPAGLAAAVYAASEGLATAVLEPEAFGGQAGTSSLIRNYLGFPRGISGAELAGRAYQQALLFGAEFVYGHHASSLSRHEGELRVHLPDGGEIRGRAVVIATGVSYRRLGVAALESLVGSGVFYGAASSEAAAMRDRRVFVVGGGNSAGQATLHLARHAAHVSVVVRRAGLADTMSDYLVQEIARDPRIDVLPETEVVDGHGAGRLEALVLRDRPTGRQTAVDADALFVMIGAMPSTTWLPTQVARDDWGYLLSGSNAAQDDGDPSRIPRGLETSMPGVFAVGDVRHGSVKRVASSAGEGAAAIQQVHEYLEHRTQDQVGGAKNSRAMPSGSRKLTPDP